MWKSKIKPFFSLSHQDILYKPLFHADVSCEFERANVTIFWEVSALNSEDKEKKRKIKPAPGTSHNIRYRDACGGQTVVKMLDHRGILENAPYNCKTMNRSLCAERIIEEIA